MTVQVIIGGVDRTGVVDLRSLQVEDRLGARSTASFVVNDLDVSIGEVIVPGVPVRVLVDGQAVFGGTIDQVRRFKATPAGVPHRYSVDCTDWHQLLDRRLVAAVYEGQTVDAIVRDIIDTWCAGEGFTTNHVQAGPVITKAVFNYLPASQAISELMETVGWSWYADPDKEIHCFPRETNPAPLSIENDSENYWDMTVERTRERYRNRQFLRAGQGVTLEQTERFYGDSKQQTFVLAYPVAQVPSITVAGQPQTVGIRGLDTGKDWYWQKGSNEVNQDQNGTPPAPSDEVVVTYRGLYPIIVQVDDPAGQDERSTAEGETGIYERVDEAPDLDDETAATERARGLLERYGIIPRVVTFSTRVKGVRAGQLISILQDCYGLSGEFLVEQVTMTCPTAAGGPEFRVRCLDGQGVGGWPEFFARMASQGKRFVIRENEVLIRVMRFAEPVACSETVTIETAAPESRVGYAAIGYSEVA